MSSSCSTSPQTDSASGSSSDNSSSELSSSSNISDTGSIDSERPMALPWMDYLDFDLEDFLDLITGIKTLDTDSSSQEASSTTGSSNVFPFPANLRGSRGSYDFEVRPTGPFLPNRVNAQDLVRPGVRMDELTPSNVALINTVIKCYGHGMAMMDRDRERLEGRTPGGLALGWANSPSYSFFGFQSAYPMNGQGQRFL